LFFLEFSMQFNATARSVQGSSASRRLRRAGRVPAIVYGAGAQPLNIELDHNEIYHALRKEEFHSSILDMKVEGGKPEQVLLRAVQWHAYKPLVLHVDFQRVDAKKTLHTKVPLHYVNAEVSPAVKLSSAIVSHVLNEVEIECLPGDLPQFIEVDLSKLEAGQSLHLSDINLPKGVAFLAHATEGNPVIVTAVVKGGAADEDEGAEGGEAAAPDATPPKA
jgi:large subunit ribosomal protein L25